MIVAHLDTKNGRADFVKRLKLRRNRNYVLILNPDGSEVFRIEKPKKFESLLAPIVRSLKDRPATRHVEAANSDPRRNTERATMHLMFFRGFAGAGVKIQAVDHLTTMPIVIDKQILEAPRDRSLNVEGVISRKGGNLHANIKARLNSTSGDYAGVIKRDTPFSPNGFSISSIFFPFYFVVTDQPTKYVPEKIERQPAKQESRPDPKS